MRKLRHKRYWDPRPWLDERDVQADAARCLLAAENRLSVFTLDDPTAQMERVVAALALTRDSLADMDLAVVPENVLEQCDIEWNRDPATTPDPGVNEWHLNLIDLTLFKVAKLASSIKTEGKIRRCSRRGIVTAIENSIKANHVARNKINRNLVSSLERRGIAIF